MLTDPGPPRSVRQPGGSLRSRRLGSNGRRHRVAAARSVDLSPPRRLRRQTLEPVLVGGRNSKGFVQRQDGPEPGVGGQRCHRHHASGVRTDDPAGLEWYRHEFSALLTLEHGAAQEQQMQALCLGDRCGGPGCRVVVVMSVISSVMRHGGPDGSYTWRLATSDPGHMAALAFRRRGDSVDWMPATRIGAAGTVSVARRQRNRCARMLGGATAALPGRCPRRRERRADAGDPA